MTDFKEKIVSELDVLRRISVTETAGMFKERSYAAAIKLLAALPHIRSVADLPPNQKGSGLGAEIRAKIATIIEKGALDIGPEVRARATALEIFQGIYGVGPKKAQELVAAGYTSIAALRAAAPSLFNKNQLIGLRYYEQLLTRIPRSEMDKHAALLMAAKPASLEGVIVGSYRRGRPDSGDIDMLVRSTDPNAMAEFVASLQATGYIREVLAHGDHKCMAICELPGQAKKARRLDILLTPPEEFPFAVFYFTGSDTFNVAVRSHALSRGWTLNEHAITQVRSGKRVSGVRSEQDLFKLLKLRWVEPTARTGPEAVVPVAP